MKDAALLVYMYAETLPRCLDLSKEELANLYSFLSGNSDHLDASLADELSEKLAKFLGPLGII